MSLGEKNCREGLNVWMNHEFNLLHHVGVVAKRLLVAAAKTVAAHEGDDNRPTPSGPTGRGVIKSRAIKECIIIT